MGTTCCRGVGQRQTLKSTPSRNRTTIKVRSKKELGKLIKGKTPAKSLQILVDTLQTEFEKHCSKIVIDFSTDTDEPTAGATIQTVSAISGYTGDGSKDYVSRAEQLKQVAQEREVVDKSISNILGVILDLLKKYTADNDVVECWEKSRVVQYVLEYYFRESTAADMLDRWVLFSVVVEICEICGNQSRLKVSMGKVGKLVSQVGTQMELLKKMDDDEVEKIHKVLKMTELYLAKVPDEKDMKEREEEEEEQKPMAEELLVSKKKLLVKKQLEFVDLENEPFIFQREYLDSANSKPSKEKLNRIRKEIVSMTNSLPEGIFVRINEDRYDKIKVMIIGPMQTPYENGCFVFDIFLPAVYPVLPPQMKLCTTGHGQFRFNPNLYQDGKVCLSLLGTWSGPGWDPSVSTILQLLVSVQAMIFVDFPYENEPTFQGKRLDPDSISYNTGIRHATLLYAMIWFLDGQHQVPSYFKEVVETHFLVHKSRILKQLEEWTDLNVVSRCGYFSWTYLFAPPNDWNSIHQKMIQLLDNLSQKQSPSKV